MSSNPLRALLLPLALGATVLACNDQSVVGGTTDRDSSVGMDADAAPQCPEPQLACDGRCVNRASDPQNCGSCGRACPSTHMCQNGGCVPVCATNETLCGGGDAGLSCANLNTDGRNCGVCGRACDRDQVCSGGVCTFMCRMGTTECSRDDGDGGTMRYCTEPMVDRNNCGACGNRCADNYICLDGRCRINCEKLLTRCPRPGADAGPEGGGEQCVDVGTDPRNCGTCGTMCPFGQVCFRNRCDAICGVGFTNCMGSCRDTQTDRNHCGGCGQACGSGEQCVEGRCTVSCPGARPRATASAATSRRT